MGEAPEPREFKRLCIAGKSHKQRVRQLTWRLRQHTVELVNASGVKFVSCDLTGLDGVELNSQHVYYFNFKTNAPDFYPLPSPPVGAKDAAHGAAALMESCQATGVSTLGTQGGCSDNALNARNTVAGFYDLTEKDANGVDANGEVVRTIVNGVVKRLLFVGSPIHQLHLFFKHWREASVGGKTDMHDPNHLQMVYKFGAILRSDQRISKSGSCNSLYQAIMNEVFGGHPKAKGWWSTIVAQEHEGRWGVSQEALAFAWRLVKAVPLDKAYGNGLAASMMAIRELLKPGCWQLDAAMQVSVWSYAVEIRFAMCMEIEIGAQYTSELDWMRNPSTRPYLSHYKSLFRLRELPAHRHNGLRRFVQELAKDPWAMLPETKQFVDDNVPEESQHLYLKRAQAGADAMKANFVKHSQFLYKDWGLVLMINGLGCAGAAARMMTAVAPDLLFGTQLDLAAAAAAAVTEHEDSEADCFFRPLFQESAEGVRHWLQQFKLVNATDSPEELRSLGEEWLFLAQHACTDYKDDPVIHDAFKEKLPLLHRRQQLNVDLCVHDSLLDEATFSVKRRIYEANLTGAAFEDLMFWETTVLSPLRIFARKLGKDAREVKRAQAATNDGDDDVKDKDQKWCSTHAQCMAVVEQVEATLVPLLDDEQMDSAPRIRKDLVEDDRSVGPLREGATRANTYSEKDAAIVMGWYESAKEKSARYQGRALSEADLIAKAAEVKLTMQLKTKVELTTELKKRAEYNFAGLPATRLKAELVCFLPFFVSCALGAQLLSWPAEGPAKARVMRGPTWLQAPATVTPEAASCLLSAVLCPPRVLSTDVKKALRVALAMRKQVAADVTPGDIFDIVAVMVPANRKAEKAVSVAGVSFLKKYLGLTVPGVGLNVPGVLRPLKNEEFGVLLAAESQIDLVKVAKLLVLRKGIAAATPPLKVHKPPDSLMKDRSLTMLATFKRRALSILEYVGSDGEAQGDPGDTPETVAVVAQGGPPGPAASMFLFGPLMMDKGRRQLIGVSPPASGVGPGLPREPPEGAFVSQLSDFAQQEQSAAAAALAGDLSPRT